MNEPLYEDATVVLDEDGLILRRYYFPIASPKRISYDRIEAVEVREMNWLTGKGRIWGTGSLRHWLPLDLQRPGKQQLVVLDLGRRISPAFSPDAPNSVARIIRDRLA